VLFLDIDSLQGDQRQPRSPRRRRAAEHVSKSPRSTASAWR
jgi:hypothetical protein